MTIIWTLINYLKLIIYLWVFTS